MSSLLNFKTALLTVNLKKKKYKTNISLRFKCYPCYKTRCKWHGKMCFKSKIINESVILPPIYIKIISQYNITTKSIRYEIKIIYKI